MREGHSPIEHLVISPYTAGDEQSLLAAYAAVVEEGGAFPRRPPVDLQTLQSAWLDGATTVQVARLDGAFVGGYFIKPCSPGAAAHIANAGYLVVKEHRGRGIGRHLTEHAHGDPAPDPKTALPDRERPHHCGWIWLGVVIRK